MNKAYRLIWSKAKERWVIAAEIIRGNGGPSPITVAAAVITSLIMAATGAHALPTGGQVAAGQAAISTPSATQMNIKQGTNQAIINWNSFGIGKGEAVNIAQPSSQSTLLNRVLGNNPSSIFGSLTANGQVFLVNPSGILFAPGSSVNVGGLVASSLNIKDSDFLAGKYSFFKDSAAGSVVNQGNISGGFVALLGNSVENAGTIVTTKGTTGLAAGDEITLGFDPNGLMAIKVDKAVYNAQVSNSGVIEADGGTVVMTASAADALLSTVVKNSGIIRARSMVERNGEIVLEGGSSGIVENSGTLDVSSAEGKGGKIVVTGEKVLIKSGAHLTASGVTGGGEVLVGGSWQNSDPAIHQATGTIVEQGALLEANATDTGNGGTVVAWSDVANSLSVTRAYGTFEAKGGPNGGVGGRIETSGHVVDMQGINISAAAPAGKAGLWLIDPADVTITQAIATTYANSLNGGTSVENAVTGDISMDANAAITMTGSSNPTLTLKATGGITLNSGSAIKSTGSGKLNVILWSDSDYSVAGGIQLNGATITTNGGGVWMGGGSGNTTWTPYSGASDITVGDGYARGLRGIGIEPNSVGTGINAGTGDIFLRGLSNQTGSFGIGVMLKGVGNTATLSGNNITVWGQGSGDTNYSNNRGVYLENGSITGSGAVSITGYGKGQNDSHGVSLNSSTIAATGSGTISIAGFGYASDTTPSTGDNNDGINLAGSSIVRTESDSITLSGTKSGVSNGQGIELVAASSTKIESTGGGSITLNTDTLSLPSTGGTLSSSGSLAIQPLTTSTTIGVGSGAGTLQIPATAFSSNFANGFSNITIGSSNAGAITVGGATTFNDSTTLLNNSSIAIGGALTATENLILTSNGAISQTAAVIVTGTTTITANAANNITLTDSGNNFGGAVSVVSGKVVSLRDSGAMLMGTSNISGNLTVQTGGALTQSGALAVTGTTGITSGAYDITLDTATNNFTGAVSVVSGKDVSLRDTDTLILGASTIAGNLTVQTGGALTQTGALLVTGISTLTAGANDVTLTQAGNNFVGAVTVASGKDVSLTDTNSLLFGGASTFSGTLNVAAATFAQATTATIAGGALSITADTIDLAGVANSISGTGMLYLAPATASRPIVIGAAGTASDFAISASELATLADGFSAIYLGRQSGTGGVQMSGALSFKDTTFIDNRGVGGSVTLGTTAAVNTNGNQLYLEAGTGDAGAFTQTNGATINTGAGYVRISADSINLNGAANSISGTGIVQLLPNTNTRPIILGAAGGVGDFALTASEIATLSNGFSTLWFGVDTNTAGLTVAGPVSFQPSVALFQNAASGAYTVNATPTVSGLLNFARSAPVTLNASVTGSGGVTFAGPVTVGANDLTVNAGTGTATFGSTVAHGTNNFTVTADNVALSGNWTGTGARVLQPTTTTQTIGLAGATGVFALDATELGYLANDAPSSVTIGRADGTGAISGGAFSFDDPLVLRGGTISQTATWNLGSTSSFAAGAANDIMLTQTNDFGGAVSVVSGANVAIKDANSITLGAISNAGNLTVEALGGDLTIGGNIAKTSGTDATATFKATGAVIQNLSTSISSTSNKLNTVLWADTDANSNGYISLSGAINTNGGHAWLGGGATGTTWNGLAVGGGSAWGNATQKNGINLYDGSSISTGAGNVKLSGATPQVTDHAFGVEIEYGGLGTANISTTTGNIDIVGASAGNSYGEGVLVHTGATVASTSGGNITIQGTGGTSTANDGIAVFGKVLANGNGSLISLTGNRSGDGTGYGVYVKGTVGYLGGTSVTSSTSNINITADTFLADVLGRVQSSGGLTIQPYTVGTTIGIVGGIGTLQLTATNFSTNFTNGFSGITIGNSYAGAITVGGTTTFNDSTTLLNNSSIAIGGAITANENLILTSNGTITQTAAIGVNGTTTITAGAANSITLANVGNNFGGAVSVVSGANISIIDSNAMTLGAVSASGTVNVATLSGNLTLSDAVATTNATAGAIYLNAGQSTAAGTTTGGDIISSGGSVSVVTGGTAKLFSGSVANSTGLTALVGSGSGRFRYNSDETNTNYSTVLTAGTNAIYREQPTVTTVANGQTMTYSGVAYSGGNGVVSSGFVNGDTSAILGGTLAYGGSSQGAINVGGYAITPSGYSNGLGYVLAYTSGTLTIDPRSVAVIGLSGSRAYDGSANVAASVFTTFSGLIGTETLTLTGTGTVADKNVGDNKTVTLGTLALGNGNNGGLASNYTLTGGTHTATITRLGSVTWRGGTTGDWLNPANWTGGAVPDLANVANVVIPTGTTVSFNGTVTAPAQAGTVSVDSITASGTGGLSMSAGTLAVANNLSLAGFGQSGGSLTVGGNATLGQTGAAITQSGGTLVVTGNTDLTAGGNNITLTSAGNDFGGAVTVVSGKDVSLTDANSLLFGGTSTFSGTLNVAAATFAQATNATIVGGALSITADTIDLAGAANSISGSGIVQLQPNTNTRPIILGADGGASDFALTASEIATLSTGFSMVRLGSSASTAGLTFTGPVSFPHNVDLWQSATSGSYAVNATPTVGGLLNFAYGAPVALNASVTGSGGVKFAGPVTVGANNLTVDAGTGTATFGSTVAHGTNNFTVTADNVALSGNWTGTGARVLQPTTTTQTIGLAGGTGAFALGTTELGYLANDAPSSVTIGRADGTGAITGAAFSFDDPLTLRGGAITQSGAWTISNALTLASSGAITLTEANDFTGTVNITNSGANNVSIKDANALSLGTVAVGSGTLTVTASGAITQSGPITQAAGAGAVSITAGATNDITLTNSGNDFIGYVSVVSAKDVSLRDSNKLALNDSAFAISGNLALQTGGDLTQKNALGVSGTTTITAGSNVTLANIVNNFIGPISVISGNNVSLCNYWTLDLGTSTISGTLVLNSLKGSLTQSGDLAVTGTTSLTPCSSNTGCSDKNVTLNRSGNDFIGTVSVGSAQNVSLADTSAFDLAGATISGNLVLQTGGGLTQSGVLVVSGTTAITAGSVTLANSGNNFTGVVSVVSGNDVNLRDTNALALAASTVSGNLTLQSGGALTQSGALTVTGTTSITAGSNDVTLNTATNNFTGAVSVVSGNNVAIKDANSITLGAISNAGNLTVEALGGDLTIAGNIAKTSGTDATATFKATGAVIQNSSTSISSTSYKLHTVLWADYDANGGAIKLNSGSSITTNGGNITLSGGVNTATGFAQSGGIYPNGVDINSASVNSGGGNIVIRGSTVPGTPQDRDGVRISGQSTAASIDSGTGTINISGKTTSSNAGEWSAGVRINYGNASSIKSANTSASAITITGDASGFTDSSSKVDGVSIEDTNSVLATGSGGGISITGIGDAGQGSGVRLGNGANVLAASGPITITGSSGITGIIGSGAAIGYRASTLVTSSSANITLITDTMSFTTDLVQSSGILTVKPYSNTTTTGIAGGTGTLQLPASYFSTNFTNGFSGITIGSTNTGAITVGGATTFNDSTTLLNNSSIAIGGALTATENLILTSNGAISQTAALGVTGTTTITAGSANNITLDNAGNNFGGAVSVVSGKDVSLRDSGAMLMGTSNISGNLTVQTGGALTQSGALAVTGTTGITADSGYDITLAHTSNNFGGAVSVVSGNNVSLRDTDSLVLGASTVSGNLTLQTGGALTQSGALVVSGTTSITAGPGNNVTLDRSDNNFTGAVSVVSGNDVNLRDTNALILGASTMAGNLTVQTVGALTQSGALAVTGTTSITAGSNDVTLNTATNNFTGVVSVVSGANVAIKDANSITLGAISNAGNLTVEALGGDLTIGGNIAKTSGTDATATFKATGTVIQNLSTSISSTSNKLNTVLWADSDENGGAIFLKPGSAISSNGGNITLAGGADTNADNIPDGYAKGIDNTANLSNGITILGASLQSTGGNFTLRGKGALASATADTGYATALGVMIGTSGANATLIDSGIGKILVNGVTTGVTSDSGSGKGFHAVEIGSGHSSDTGTVTIRSANATNDAISISGDASGFSVDTSQELQATGVQIFNPANRAVVVEAATGGIVIDGKASQSANVTADGWGFRIYNANNNIASVVAAGPISITGQGNAAITSFEDIELNKGTIGYGSGTSITSSSGNIILNGNSLGFDADSRLQSSGKLTIQPRTADTTIGIANGTGTLSLPASYFSTNFTNGFSGITIGSTNTGAITVGGATTFNDSTTLLNNSSIAIGGAITAAKNLILTSNGAISQNAAVSVTGTTAITAGSANNITLDNADNDFGGAVTVVSGNTVRLTDANRLLFGGTSAFSGSLIVTAATFAQDPHATITGTVGAVGAGELRITADTIDLGGTTDSISGTGLRLNLLTATPSRPVVIGAVGGVNDFALSATELATLKDGFSNISLGNELGTGGVRLSGVLSFNDLTMIYNGGVGGSITLDADARVNSNGNALYLFAGTGNAGAFTQTANATISGIGDRLVINADSIALNGAANSISGSGFVWLYPKTDTRPVILGADGGASDFALTASEIATLSNGFSMVRLGSDTSTAGLTFTGPVSFPHNVDLWQSATSGSYTVNATPTVGGLLNFAYGAPVALNASVTGSGGVTFAGPVTVGANNLTVDAGTGTATFSSTVAHGTNNFTITANDAALSGNWTGTGARVLQPSTTTQTIGLAGATGAFALDTTELGYLKNAAPSSVTIGRADGTGAITGAAFSFDDPLVLRGGAITQTGTWALSNTASLQSGNNNIALTEAGNNFTGAVSVVSGKDVSIINSNAMTLGAVTSSGTVDIATLTGDLTLSGLVQTTNNTDSAIKLNAAKGAAAGTSSGGDILISGGSVSVGDGGRATLFSGDIANTTLATLVGSSSGRFRYHSDETTDFSTGSWTALGTGTYAIYRKQPTLTVTADNKSVTYGTAPSLSTTPSGLENGDTSGQAISTDATVAIAGSSSTSGNYIAGIHTLTPSGAVGGLGYAFNFATGTLTVDKKDLTVSGLTASNKTYDTFTTAPLGGTATVTALAGDTVTLGGTAAGTFVDKTAANNKTVTVTGKTLTGSNDDGNYNLIQQTGLTANISKVTLTTTGAVAQDKNYDTTTAATITGETLAGVLLSDTVSVSGGGTFADKNAGNTKAVTAALALGGTDAGNYTLTQPTGLTANITKADLTVTGLTASNKTYDTFTTASLGGTAAVTALGNDVVTLGGTASGTFANKAAGNNKVITITGKTLTGSNDDGNYNLIQQSGLTANITKADLVVTGLTANSKTYDTFTTATLGGTAEYLYTLHSLKF